jgi:hypothetical protein
MAVITAFYYLHNPTMIYQWEGCVNNKMAPRKRRIYLIASPSENGEHQRANPFYERDIGLAFKNDIIVLNISSAKLQSNH